MLRTPLFVAVSGSLLLASLALAAPALPPRDSTWTRTEYGTFRTLDADDVQLRLCYVGGWISPFLSMRIASRPLPIDRQHVSPYLASVTHCDDAIIEIRVPRQRLSALIDSFSTIPHLAEGHVEGKGGVSLVLATRVSQHRSFEAILEPTQKERVMHYLLSILGDDPAILDDLTDVGCQLGMVSDERAVDVTPLVSTRIGRVTHVRGSTDVTCVVTVRNRSDVPIEGPIDVTVSARAPSVYLVRRSGNTCVTGREYRESYTRLLWKAALLPGNAVSGRIRLTNPDDETVTFDEPRVLAGPGSR